MDLSLGQLGHLQTKGNVVKHIQVRKQRIALKHRVDLPPVGRLVVHTLSVKQHIAGGGRKEAANDPQHGGLSATGRAKQREKFMVIDI